MPQKWGHSRWTNFKVQIFCHTIVPSQMLKWAEPILTDKADSVALKEDCAKATEDSRQGRAGFL